MVYLELSRFEHSQRLASDENREWFQRLKHVCHILSSALRRCKSPIKLELLAEIIAVATKFLPIHFPSTSAPVYPC
jgi:hypothetical protein